MARIGLFIDQEKTRYIQFDADTEVLVRFVGKKELSELQRKAQKAARLGGADVKDVFNQKLGKAAVKGWRKIGDPEHPGLVVDDKPFPFSEKNLALLMEHSLDFSQFVNATAVEAREFLEEEELEREEELEEKKKR